jgi:putative peptide zinc metalloprotease protein
MFSPFMTLVYIATVFVALIILLSNRLELAIQLKTIGPNSIPLIYITVIFITIIHELSHGYACKNYGGKVSEMGFLLLYALLSFYTNISDAYLFSDKKKRMSVTAAGIKNQIILWALATIIWRVMAPETIFYHVALIIIGLSFLLLIFNLNPLLKLDGYYYLVDFWGITNLRSKAFGFWKQKIFRLISGKQQFNQFTAREIRIFNWYGLAAIIYSTGLFGYILFKASRFIFWQIGIFTLAIFYAVILYMVFEAMKKAGFGKIIMSEKGNILRPRNWITILAAIVGLSILSAIMRLDLKISQDCLIYPIESLTIRSTDAGYVELTLDRGSGEKNVQRLNLTGQNLNVLSIDPLVMEGDQIKSGEMLAKIRSTESEAELSEAQANLDRARSQLSLLKKGAKPEEIAQTDDLIKQVRMKINKSNSDLARAEELASQNMISKEELDNQRTSNEILKSELSFYQQQKRLQKKGARPEELDIAGADIRAIQAQISRLQSQLTANDIISPINGLVTSVKTDDNIITVARIDTMRVRIPVPEKEISPVAIGQKVKLKVRGYPGTTFEGIVSKISGQTESGALQPVFVVTAMAINVDGLLKPGMTGHAKIYCGKMPAYKIAFWRVIRWFRVEFWSWY